MDTHIAVKSGLPLLISVRKDTSGSSLYRCTTRVLSDGRTGNTPIVPSTVLGTSGARKSRTVRPTHVPGQSDTLEKGEQTSREIHLETTRSVAGGSGGGVMVIVP